MQDMYYVGVPNFETLLSDECSSILDAMRSRGLKVCVAIKLTKNFDEWDIEKYVQGFFMLGIEQLKITVCKDWEMQPTYKQIMEVQGALRHFADFDGCDEKTGCQKFHKDAMKIFFCCEPI